MAQHWDVGMTPRFGGLVRTGNASTDELRVCDPLLIRESDGLLIVMNPRYGRPLGFFQGQTYIRTVLERSACASSGIAIEQYRDDPELLRLLADHRILVKEELEPSQVVDGVAGEKPRSINLYLLVTQGCNLGCHYCLAGRKGYMVGGRMDPKVAIQGIERALLAIADRGLVEVIYFGGEPLLNWPLCKATMDYFGTPAERSGHGARIHHHFTTNLTLLPRDFVEYAKRYRATVLVDIDGAQNVHDLLRPYKNGRGSYGRIVQNLSTLAAAGIPFTVRTTVTSCNVYQLTELAEHHFELGARSIAFPLLVPVDSDTSDVDEHLYPDVDVYVDQLLNLDKVLVDRKGSIEPIASYRSRILHGSAGAHDCGMPKGQTPVLTKDGEVFPCIYLVSQDKYRIGNVLNDDFDYFDNACVRQIRSRFAFDNQDECSDCEVRPICKGGCPIHHMWSFAAENQSRPFASGFCRMHQRLIDGLLVDAVAGGLEASGEPFR